MISPEFLNGWRFAPPFLFVQRHRGSGTKAADWAGAYTEADAATDTYPLHFVRWEVISRMKQYVVRPGDTLWKISKATGVKLHLLMAANPQIKDPDKLVPGQVISIPELGKAPSPVPAAGQETGAGPYLGFVWPHVVVAGDTWESLAEQYHVTAAQIMAANPMHQGRPLQPGEIIYIPMTTSPLATADGQPTAAVPAPSSTMDGAVVPAQPVPEPGTMPAMDTAPFEPPGMGPHTHYPYRGPSLPRPYGAVAMPMSTWRWAPTPYGWPHPLPFGHWGPWHAGVGGWWHGAWWPESSWAWESSFRDEDSESSLRTEGADPWEESVDGWTIDEFRFESCTDTEAPGGVHDTALDGGAGPDESDAGSAAG